MDHIKVFVYRLLTYFFKNVKQAVVCIHVMNINRGLGWGEGKDRVPVSLRLNGWKLLKWMLTSNPICPHYFSSGGVSIWVKNSWEGCLTTNKQLNDIKTQYWFALRNMQGIFSIINLLLKNSKGIIVPRFGGKGGNIIHLFNDYEVNSQTVVPR